MWNCRHQLAAPGWPARASSTKRGAKPLCGPAGIGLRCARASVDSCSYFVLAAFQSSTSLS
jgi:hypothetical protein